MGHGLGLVPGIGYRHAIRAAAVPWGEAVHHSVTALLKCYFEVPERPVPIISLVVVPPCAAAALTTPQLALPAAPTATGTLLVFISDPATVSPGDRATVTH